eukprot:scaffold11872_cov58-Cyclotella_meneghiniana.AAC.2
MLISQQKQHGISWRQNVSNAIWISMDILEHKCQAQMHCAVLEKSDRPTEQMRKVPDGPKVPQTRRGTCMSE